MVAVFVWCCLLVCDLCLQVYLRCWFCLIAIYGSFLLVLVLLAICWLLLFWFVGGLEYCVFGCRINSVVVLRLLTVGLTLWFCFMWSVVLVYSVVDFGIFGCFV